MMKTLMILSLLFIVTTGNKTEARCIECEKEIISTAEKLIKEEPIKSIDQTLTQLLQSVKTMSKEKKDRCIECEKEVKSMVEKSKKELENIDQTLASLLQVVKTISKANDQLVQELKICEGR